MFGSKNMRPVHVVFGYKQRSASVQCRVGCVGGQYNSPQGLLVMTSSSSCGQWCLWVRPLVMWPGLVGGRLIVFISIFCTCFCGVYSNNGYKPVFVAVSCMRCKCDGGADILKLFFVCFFFYFQCALANLLPILRLWPFLVKVSQKPRIWQPYTVKTVSARRQISLYVFIWNLSKITWVCSSKADSLRHYAFEPLN